MKISHSHIELKCRAIYFLIIAGFISVIGVFSFLSSTSSVEDCTASIADEIRILDSAVESPEAKTSHESSVAFDLVDENFSSSTHLERDLRMEAAFNNCWQKYPFSYPDDIMQQMKVADIVAQWENSDGSNFFVYGTDTYSWVKDTNGEIFVTTVFNAFGKKCKEGTHVMWDIGSNSGMFGLLAASWGCESFMFDAQPKCQLLEHDMVVKNNFDNAHVIPHPISDAHDKIAIYEIDQCGGRFPASNVDANRKHAYGERRLLDAAEPILHIPFLDMKQFYSECSFDEILLAKIDTEGQELNILGQVMPYLENNKIMNLMVECTPKWWKNTGFTLEQGIERLQKIKDMGYQFDCLGAESFKPCFRRLDCYLEEDIDIKEYFMRKDSKYERFQCDCHVHLRDQLDYPEINFVQKTT